MPGNSLKRTFDPKENIDLSLFAHIHNDPFLVGAYKLQGNQFLRTVSYLEKYLKSIPEREETKEAHDFFKRMHEIVDVEQSIVDINGLSDALAKPKLKALCDSITRKLVGELQEGAYLTLPGGWSTPVGESHAMVYQFKRTDKGLEFYIHNSGAGISYHERKSARDREMYYPVQTYFIPNPIDPDRLNGFIHDLILPQLPKLRAQKDQLFDAKRLYERVFPKISFLKGELVLAGAKSGHAYTAGQLSGTCSQRSLHQMLKENFKSLHDYQRFIYAFKRDALEDFIISASKSKTFFDERVRILMRKGINTLLRTLNTQDLFTAEEIELQRNELKAWREILKTEAPKDAPSGPVLVETPTVSSFVLEAIPTILNPSIHPLTPSPPLKDTPIQTLDGGHGLFRTMHDLYARCERLKSEGQQTTLIEELELIFSEFPLPSPNHQERLDRLNPKDDTFNRMDPFYQDINPENKLEFYRLMTGLQDHYLEACKSIGSEVALPRMLVVGLSALTVMDYVDNQFHLAQSEAPLFHTILARYMTHFFKYYHPHPAYFATNNPTLDTRLKSIQSLYDQGASYYSNDLLLEHYKNMINSMPNLKDKLRLRYETSIPKDAKLAGLLESNQCQELYCLTTFFSELSQIPEYRPLIEQFNGQKSLERCYFRAIEPFSNMQGHPDEDIKLGLGYSGNELKCTSVASQSDHAQDNGRLLKQKYNVSPDLACQHALGMEYHMPNYHSDNVTQLFPSDYKAETPSYMTPESAEQRRIEEHKLAQRHIQAHDIEEREFFHLRGSPQHQIKLTLDYFKQDLSKLSEPSCQIYVEANLFEPGLLMAELKTNRDQVLNQIDRFIDAGLKLFAEHGQTSQTSLFFIRLAYLVNHYDAHLSPQSPNERLDALQKQLSNFLQVDTSPSIRQTLYQYQLLTAIARLKLHPTTVSAEEQRVMLQLILPSYIYMNAHQNPDAFMDSSMRFELECTKKDVKKLLSQSEHTLIAKIVSQSLENLNLGLCEEGTATKTDSLYTVRMKKGDTSSVYNVDVERGLVFNALGMAYAPIPPDILHHPVMRFLNIKALEPCFTSSDGLVFELGSPNVRFIRENKGSPYRVQQQWTVNNQTQWYELHDLSAEQKAAFQLETQTIHLPFPSILKERSANVWVSCEDASLLITEGQKPSYHCKKTPDDQWVAKRLENGLEHGMTLCIGDSWLLDVFAQFEDKKFITVCQNGNEFEVKFGRYGLTLLVNRDTLSDRWVFRLQDNPAYTLVGDVNTLLPGVTGLIFEDKATQKKCCYLPVQAFINTNRQSAHSEFYDLQQDVSGKIPMHVVEKTNQASSEVLLPWQYTGSEQIATYPLTDGGVPRPETATDALYLCYVYLGSQQVEKAWEVLEDCAKRLGGLKGTIEELTRLNMIIHSLPHKIEGADKEATISTPAYVACQLKAMALLTSSFTPDKVISFPEKSFDLKSPDGRYQNKCYEEVKVFNNTLNNTIFTFYSRFQNMQRHLDQCFYLKDDEKKSLLDYYHFNLPEPPHGQSKALGALGYEWVVLGLKTLKRERESILAEQRIKQELPIAYQARLRDIEAFLARETIVRANHTTLELLGIDLSIPTEIVFRIPSAASVEQHRTLIFWMENISRGLGAEKGEEALALLTPEITDLQLLEHFMYYYEQVTNLSSKERDTIIDFCEKYLMASRHTPLDKQDGYTAYLCNILYHISKNHALFDEKIKAKMKYGMLPFVDMLKVAQSLPDPMLEIYQALNTTSDILDTTRNIWESLGEEVLAPSLPIMASPCTRLLDFTVERLIQACELDKAAEEGLFEHKEAYRKQARIFGRPPKETRSDIAQSQVLSQEELDAGSEQCDALQKMKDIASKMLRDASTCKALGTSAQRFVDALDDERKQRTETLLLLANAGPQDLKKKQRRDVELDSGARAPLDEQHLFALYFKADKVSYALATGLSDPQIEELHSQLSHLLAISVRQQGLKRLMDATNEAADPSALQHIAHELLTEDLVNYETESVLALFQYYENVLLRPQQIEAIKRLSATPGIDRYAFVESIEKIIMGGGKSKVMLPLLAQIKATGNNLVVIEVPRPLFETNCVDLSNTSSRLFDQKARPFEFNRNSDCSAESLEFMYSTLIDTIVRKDYLVTTGDSIQSLELKYLDLLIKRPEGDEDIEAWTKKIEWLDKLVTLFRTRADVVMDEVHQALQLKKKLNYTLGEKHPIPLHITSECVEIYRFFEHVRLSDHCGEMAHGKSLDDVLKNNQWITTDTQWQAAMADLRQALVQSALSPLNHMLNRMQPKPSPLDIESLLRYLANEGDTIPAFILNSPSKTKNTFALYKEQINQLLPQTLKRKLNEHYGASKQHIKEGIAIPYVANNVPSEQSRFGNYLEAINYTIHMLMIDGVRPETLKQYLGQLQAQARQEFLKNPELAGVELTESCKQFQRLAPDVGFSLNEIRLDETEQFNVVFNAIHSNKDLICEVLKTDLLMQIQIESEILHSDAFSLVDSYRSCQGITGTPSNSSTYHQRLAYHKQTAAATDGFIISRLKEKKTTIRSMAHTSTDTLLAGLFSGKDASDSMRAIIDICATFKGIENLDVAKAIAQYVRGHAIQFSIPAPLKYILFFNNDNILCALPIEEGKTPITIGSTDPDAINLKLGCSPDERFSYYDQSHTVGVDLKQARRAKAFVLADHETPLQSFLQGCLRMRGLQDEQSVEIIMPESYKNQDIDLLMTQMATHEEQQLQQDVFSATQAKMTNIIRNDLLKRVLALPSENADKKHLYAATAFRHYFVEQASHDFFKLYGSLASKRSAKDILAEQCERLIKDWSTILQNLPDGDQPIDIDKMRSDLTNIITSALPLCQPTYLSPTQQEQDMTVEVQKQTRIEQKKERQQQLATFNPKLEPEGYDPILSDRLLDVAFEYNLSAAVLSLNVVCQSGNERTTVPDFGEIYATKNYYKTYKDQTQFTGDFLKPVHALLFRMRPNGSIDCLILSQKDAEELTLSFDFNTHPQHWLSTTQHTVLSGHPPQDIMGTQAYQDLVEKVRFFNGELSLLLNSGEPLNWLNKETEQKLSYFEQHLLPYRKTQKRDLAVLRQSLSQRLSAFALIAKHPLDDYIDHDWRADMGEEFTEADVLECQNLARAFVYATSHWREQQFNAQQCVSGSGLSMQAASYVYDFVEHKLAPLRKVLPLYETQVDPIKPIIDSCLPVLIHDYIPKSRETGLSLLQFLLTKASFEANQDPLLSIAAWLIEKAAVTTDELSHALTVTIQNGGIHILTRVRWLLEKDAIINVPEDTWNQVDPVMMKQFFHFPQFQHNTPFLLAYVFRFKGNDEELIEVITTNSECLMVLQKIIDVKQEISHEFIDLLLISELFASNVGLISQLLEKVGDKLYVLNALSRDLDSMSTEVLDLVFHYKIEGLSSYAEVYLSKYSLDQLSAKSSVKILTCLSDDQLDTLFKSDLFKKNQAEIIEKLLEDEELPKEQSPKVFEILLKNQHVTLTPDEMELFLSKLDQNGLQPLLPMAASKTDNLGVLEHIIILNQEHPGPLIKVLLAKPDIRNNLYFINILIGILNNLNDPILNNEMVQKICNNLEGLPHDVIHYLFNKNLTGVGRFGDYYIINYLNEGISPELLKNIVLSIDEPLKDTLFKSDRFQQHQEAMVAKLLLSSDSEIFAVVLKNQHVQLSPDQLMNLLSTAEHSIDLQSLLPDIAAYKTANADVLKKVIELSEGLEPELQEKLITNPALRMNVELVRQCCTKLNDDNAQTVFLRALAKMPELSQDVIDLTEEAKSKLKRQVGPRRPAAAAAAQPVEPTPPVTATTPSRAAPGALRRVNALTPQQMRQARENSALRNLGIFGENRGDTTANRQTTDKDPEDRNKPVK